MNELELAFQSANTKSYSKKIFVYVVQPSKMTRRTGLMHFAHGWGGNRYQYREMQRDFSDRYNLVCISTEFRQSGFYFDPVTGTGADLPYDASHYQVLDCLNAVRKTLSIYPALNRRRLISFGGSQGGHIAMLMGIFAPNTFACIVAACSLTRIDESISAWTGRDFSADELAVRDVVRMAGLVKCPVALMHGTADRTVPDIHTRMLEKALRESGKTVRSKYVKGGGHALEPVTDRKTTTIRLAGDWLASLASRGKNDFDLKTKVEIPCATKKCVLDWSKPHEDASLLSWAAM
ncbi:MAG: prolyl oligopeptidase family serine peptidase [Kiritimatiellia bacterium]